VAQVGDGLDRFGHDVVAWGATQPRDEADTAGIVLEARIVQTFGPRK
jgi:hypothetical protein